MNGASNTVTRDAAPIFIVGAPRSGTSLLRNLLNRHPAIGLCDETYYFYYVYERRRAFGDLAEPAARQRLIDKYLATSQVRHLGIPLDELNRVLLRDGTSYAAFFTTLLRCYATAHRKQRYGEKTPQHVFSLSTLCDWYPGCRIIHLIRDPRDVVASLLRMPWGRRNVIANVRLWRDCVLAGERFGASDNCLRVRYEDLVAALEPELKRVCEFIGEDYRADMLLPSDAPAAAAWWFQRALEPVTTARRGAWRDQLTRDDVAVIEWVAAPLMHRLGYEREAPAIGRALRARATAAAVIDAARERFRQLPRMWYYWARPTQLAAEESWIHRWTPADSEPAPAPQR